MVIKKEIFKFDKVPNKDGTELQKSINIISNYSKNIDKNLFNKEIIDYYLNK